MLEQIKAAFNAVWAILKKIVAFLSGIFTWRTSLPEEDLSDEEKYGFIKSLIKRKSGDAGFALRHVDTDQTRDENMSKGFYGDAISLSITDHVMGKVLNENIKVSAWKCNEGQFTFFFNDINNFFSLDMSLAIKIYNYLHGLILQFIERNYQRDVHHFMVIKDMRHSFSPYDIGLEYPTGKCGKQDVASKNILRVFSKSDVLNSPDKLVHALEKGMIQIGKPG